MTEEKKLITTKVKPYIIGLICIICFYSYEFINDYSDNYYISINNYKKAKDNRTEALNKVKEFAKGSIVYNKYLDKKSIAEKTWEKHNKIKKEEQFFGFKSLHFFWERFGLFLGIFVYALYNLFLSFSLERKNIGSKVIHGFIVSVCMFYFFWIFQQFQDFSKPTYYFMTFVSAAIIVFAVSLISKYQNLGTNKLKETISRLAAFSFLHTKQEKKPEMLELFKELSKDS